MGILQSLRLAHRMAFEAELLLGRRSQFRLISAGMNLVAFNTGEAAAVVGASLPPEMGALVMTLDAGLVLLFGGSGGFVAEGEVRFLVGRIRQMVTGRTVATLAPELLFRRPRSFEHNLAHWRVGDFRLLVGMAADASLVADKLGFGRGFGGFRRGGRGSRRRLAKGQQAGNENNDGNCNHRQNGDFAFPPEKTL